jgi:REP element-mobilizing transposase RayT
MAGGFILNRSRIFPHARSEPVFRPLNEPCLDRVQVNALDFIVVFLHGAQGTVKESRLPQFAALGAPAIDEDGRADPGGFHDLRNGERIDGSADGVPVVGKKNPGRQIKRMLPPRAVQGERQLTEIAITQPAPSLKQTHSNKEITIGKKGTPEPRHGARIQQRERPATRRTADLKPGGPRYPLPATVHDEANGRVWQRRFYDMNIWSEKKINEKLDYVHNNPVERKLAGSPGDWPWSSWRYYFQEDASIIAMDRMPG